uniref:Protein kinase domain-containing protein n=1 Tax=Caenorhabditis tropicalis TaxID=1561998 RepID=A0A1I7V3W5_9PELO
MSAEKRVTVYSDRAEATVLTFEKMSYMTLNRKLYQFHIGKKIAGGTYGKVFECLHDENPVEKLVLKSSKGIPDEELAELLTNEVDILKHATNLGSDFFPKFVDSFIHGGEICLDQSDFKTTLASSLRVIVKRSSSASREHFSFFITLVIFIETSMNRMSSCPANVTLESCVKLSDFGTAGRFIGVDGEEIVPNDAGIRFYQASYASLSVHLKNPPTRFDDFESLLYMMYEINGGQELLSGDHADRIWHKTQFHFSPEKYLVGMPWIIKPAKTIIMASQSGTMDVEQLVEQIKDGYPADFSKPIDYNKTLNSFTIN